MPAPRTPRPRRAIPETFRRILVSSVWTDLSSLQERARILWLRLAIAAEATAIPGLVLIAAPDLAAALTAPASPPWSAEEVERVAATIPEAMMLADWRAGVVWLPPVFRWQPPASPKNVAAWRRPWASLPSTPLAPQIHDDLRLTCAGRGPSFVRAFADLAAPAPAPVTPMSVATIHVDGTAGDIRVSAAGLAAGSEAAIVQAVARQLGVSISIAAPAIVERPAGAEQVRLPAVAVFASPPAPPRRRNRVQAVLEDRSADLDRVLAYQAERRRAAFELAEQPETAIDADECRTLIAGLIAGGAAVVELETAIDRQYERVGAAGTQAHRRAAAGWWTATVWQPAKYRELLALQVGASAPASATRLAKLVNEAAPPGATPIRHLADLDVGPLAMLLGLRGDATAILAAAQKLAGAVAEQERQLRRRPQAQGEARLVTLWGPQMFRPSVWPGVAEVLEAWEDATDDLARGEVFRRLSAALQGEGASPAAARTS
jgi:hypothetical protein